MTEAATYVLTGTIYVLVGNIVADSPIEITTETADDFAKTANIPIHFRLSARTTSERKIAGMLQRVMETVLKNNEEIQEAQGARTIFLNELPSTPVCELTQGDKLKGTCPCTIL